MGILLLCLAAFTITAQGQLTSKFNEKTAKGTFYVSVDDGAIIHLNGQKFFDCGIGEHKSPETELKTGDRIVVSLREEGGGRRFMLVFASTDGQTIVSFGNRDFKIIPDIGVADFTAEQFETWKKFAKEERRKDVLPVKNYSDWVWGDLNKCSLACIVSASMFTQRPK